jgi:hypothetical protein
MPIAVSGSNIVFADGSSMASGFTGFRNRIINGAMVIDQRNAGSSTTPTDGGTYNIDRWQTSLTQASKFSVQRNAGSVTPPAGFTNYLGITSLSAYTVGSSDFFMLNQAIEGFTMADLNFGTVNAKTVTLSFWVRSSLTGTFGGAINNEDNSRGYPFSYTISSANTWEQKSITVPGDTSGTWIGATNGRWGYVRFGLGVGTTNSTTAGAWAGANYFSATGATSVVGTNGATFYITGVQLEAGTTSSSFEYRPYGTELALCQRYYKQYIDGSSPQFTRVAIGENVTSARVDPIIIFPVVMRAAPTISISSISHFSLYSGGGITVCNNLYVDIASPITMNFIAAVPGSPLLVAGASQLLSNTNCFSKLKTRFFLPAA